MKLTEEQANRVYDVLTSLGGASIDDRDDFVYHHCRSKNGCNEWRFCGKFGFGGKYRSGINSVTYYPEDETPDRIKLAAKIQVFLDKIF